MIHQEPPAEAESAQNEDNPSGMSRIPIAFQKYPLLWALCQACWNFEPTFRPNRKGILWRLQEAAEVQALQALSNRAPLESINFGSCHANGRRVGVDQALDPFLPFRDFSFCFDPSTHPLFQGAASTSPFEDFSLPFDPSTHLPFQTSEASFEARTGTLGLTSVASPEDLDSFSFGFSPLPPF